MFKRPDNLGRATDWDNYYKHVAPTARLTRRFTSAALVNAMKRHGAPMPGNEALSILEIGGANSCFLEQIVAQVGCRRYDVVDTNAYGLSLLEQRLGSESRVRLHQQSVLDLSLDEPADLVFSVGLIEHFDQARTRRAVEAHLDVLRPGGVAIITFPTPTLLYRITRWFFETLGIWQFPDERPLEAEEVLAAVGRRADVLSARVLWPLFLTQTLLVLRKRADAPAPDVPAKQSSFDLLPFMSAE